jgi:ATP-dependent DNA helicase RecQ
VARVQQNRGVGHVADVLLGRASEKIQAAGHDQLSTFGLLNRESGTSIRGYIEQLVAAGLLVRDGDPYPVLRLTSQGLTLLKGDGACELFRERPPEKGKTSRLREGVQEEDGGQDLFDRLRAVRLRLARARGVPPYVIFHDTTLRQMAEVRPATIDDLHQIYGVGARKAKDFGDEFLDVIRAFGG